MGGGGRSAFHSRRSLEEGGHVVCGEYGEDWKRAGEGAGELTRRYRVMDPCRRSSGGISLIFHFFSPREAEVTQETQCCGRPCAGILRRTVIHVDTLYCRWVIQPSQL